MTRNDCPWCGPQRCRQSCENHPSKRDPRTFGRRPEQRRGCSAGTLALILGLAFGALALLAAGIAVTTGSGWAFLGTAGSAGGAAAFLSTEG